jgi:hypothetical protein
VAGVTFDPVGSKPNSCLTCVFHQILSPKLKVSRSAGVAIDRDRLRQSSQFYERLARRTPPAHCTSRNGSRLPMFPHSRPPAVTKVTFGKTYCVEVSRPPAVTKVTFGKTYCVEVSRPPAVTKVTFGKTYRVEVCVHRTRAAHS